MRRGALVAFASLLAGGAMHAQSCTTSSITSSSARTCTTGTSTSTATTMTNPKLLRLTISPAASAVSVTTAMLDDGRTTELPVSLTVEGNRSWALAVSGGPSGTWTATGTYAWRSKPLGDLKWSLTSGGAGAAMTTSPVQIASGSATGSSVTTLYFVIALSYANDGPGSYSTPVTFTVTTP